MRSKSMETILLISLGAVLGANLRYWLNIWVTQKVGTAFPYGTLLVNLTGSFILGLFLTLIAESLSPVDPRWRVLVAVGFLGSYTTFSSYTYESVNLMLAGQVWSGLFNLFGSSFLGGLAVVLGVLTARVL
jgi:CrcB protein